MQKIGKTGPDQAPAAKYSTYTDSRGNTHQVPEGVDPGFGRVPGSSLDRAKTLAREKAAGYPEPLRRDLLADVAMAADAAQP